MILPTEHLIVLVHDVFERGFVHVFVNHDRYHVREGNPVYVSRVDCSDFVFSLSSHRQSYIGLVFVSRFLDS